eukprot:jgi/Tetstr1/430432/TSEL_020242.t1
MALGSQLTQTSNTKDRLEVVYPHLHGKLTRFPIEFFPLATNSPCFSVGNLPQTVRHFGFSDTAANKIALTLDMVPTKVFTSTAASGVRKLSVRALPEPHNEHAYADRKRALQETNGSQGAWPETSWQDAVESVLFVECRIRTVKHCGYSIRSVREWHNDSEMRRQDHLVGFENPPMKLRRKHSEKRGPSPPLKMAKELEDDDPFQAPKPKREKPGQAAMRLRVPLLEVALPHLPVAPAPTPLAGRLVAPRLVGESPPITDPTVATLVGNQDFLQTRVRSFFGSQDLCDRVADLGDRLVAARLAGSLGEEKAWTFIGGGRKQLHLDMSGPDDLRLRGRGGDVNMRAFLASDEHRLVYNELRGICNEIQPEVLAELRKVRNLCNGRLAQSKSLVPLGVADDRYRMDVCDGNEDAATYSRPGLAFLLPAHDVHASPPKGGVNPAFATRCPICKEVAGVSPCFRIFLSLHPNTGAMMPGQEWQILSYHVPGLAAFLPEVDHTDEAYHRMHETARTMAAAKEMRHWSPETHIGDDDYILEDVKAAVVEATAGKTDEQEMRRVEKINREGWDYPHLRSWGR